jgi:nitronate monooxygenase
VTLAWRDRRLLDLFGIETPIVQAPMAAAQDAALAIAAIQGGALGSLPCALLTPDTVRAQVAEVRAAVERDAALLGPRCAVSVEASNG